ncbi:hypothetical protein [Rhizobium sp. Leaf383]|uniref:hypothetical protein n=1 Tax=Rhizobium sp. Leaf383 TaxID=1736357 RepID=UPI0007126409|nr:hypothetical protein [Rhizobium sp. Leaf383]KQS84286.1 hypothetical protein ASG58_21180 [Rhizobium sp. Leaf383]
MVVATVTQTGGFVLPEGIMRVSDIMSYTAPAKGLDECEPTAIEYRVFHFLVLTSEGRVIADRTHNFGLKEVEELNAPFCQHIHVYRDGADPYAFYHTEVVRSIELNPWMHHTWFKDNFLRWAEMLPRPSDTIPGRISYYQTPEKRARDIRTPIKPGRWLTKYFSDILTEVQIHELALEWSNACNLQAFKLTQDADEIERIYRHGPNSCMTFTNGGYRGSCHPARVYAGPDLGVAYLGETTKATARAVVWPAKKLFGRIYGDESRLQAALIAGGYQHASTDDFDGARLQRIRHGYGDYVLPYLDVTCGADDDGQYIVLGSGHLNCESTSGTTDNEPEYSCDSCGDGMDDDDRNYIGSTEEDVCNHCCSLHYSFCDGNQEYYRNREMRETADGTSYSKEYLQESSKFFFCEATDKYYSYEDDERVSLYEGLDVARSYLDSQDGFFCEHYEEWSLETDKEVKLTNGKSVHMGTFRGEDDFKKYLAENEVSVLDPVDPNQLTLPLPLSEAA